MKATPAEQNLSQKSQYQLSATYPLKMFHTRDSASFGGDTKTFSDTLKGNI